jgi:diadenosine tetraphosphate (Ap4A) HIT family hydrolase/5-methylcytosine-specific restriction endonuclease McrA
MSPIFDEVSDFISSKMRMSHIYQPAMLIELLTNHGSSTVTEIAKALLLRDPSQVDYYEQITKNMVGRVLTSHALAKRIDDSYHLPGYDQLSASEIEALVALCESKIESYLESRNDPWSHRRKSSGYISGRLKYQVLANAKKRCLLCGTPDHIKPLEVDHIVPRNRGGTDDMSNLQALCYSCNAMKRDTDDTDFRGVAESYEHRDTVCVFCESDNRTVLFENQLCYALEDRFPVTQHHTLIIPKRHVPGYFDLYQPELSATHSLLAEAKKAIEKMDQTVSGFNVGVNSGVDAGQTIFHCHVHLIPRRAGDTVDPSGGVRGVIPGKQRYLQ